LTAPPAANPNVKLRRVDRAAPFVGTSGPVGKIRTCGTNAAELADNADEGLKIELALVQDYAQDFGERRHDPSRVKIRKWKS